MHFFSLGPIPVWIALAELDRHVTKSVSFGFPSLRLYQEDSFRKHGEVVPLQPRDGIIECEDLGAIRGLDSDLGGVQHVQETLFIGVDVNAAILGPNVEGRRVPGENATARGTQFD